jgi:hypothetical protein
VFDGTVPTKRSERGGRQAEAPTALVRLMPEAMAASHSDRDMID